MMDIFIKEGCRPTLPGYYKVQNNRHAQHTDTQTNINIIDNTRLKHKTVQKITYQHTRKRREHKAIFKPR